MCDPKYLQFTRPYPLFRKSKPQSGRCLGPYNLKPLNLQNPREAGIGGSKRVTAEYTSWMNPGCAGLLDRLKASGLGTLASSPRKQLASGYLASGGLHFIMPVKPWSLLKAAEHQGLEEAPLQLVRKTDESV